MPKAEGYQGKKEDTIVLNNEDLESGQRYGLMENERVMSGCKRFCFCYGYTLSWCKYKFIPYFLLFMYPIVFIMGFYSGRNSNCPFNTTLT
tara:strand:- start:653 stop:925 length:273 start_codon:yes stop_codon:yes gene_type:complete